MRHTLAPTLKGFLLVCALVCVAAAVAPCRAQGAAADSTRQGKAKPPAVSVADGQGLLDKIKEVESPAFRAYLYTRVARWLWQSAGGDDVALRRAAFDGAVVGVADIHRHEREMPPVAAASFYAGLMAIIRRHNPEEAERQEREHPLSSNLNQTEADKANREFHSALAGLGDPRRSAQSLELAERLISSGRVPATTLHGELIHLDQSNSPALPRLLSATLGLEERTPGSIPLRVLFFMPHFFFKEGVPPELSARFLAAAVRAARLTPAQVEADPHASSWAAQLLRVILPHVQKLSPPLYAEASARLAALSPGGAGTWDTVFERIRNSTDPLSQTISEADSTTDERLKSELLRSAARTARRQGKLAQAVKLVTSAEEDRRGLPEDYSWRDEFLNEVAQDALKIKDLEIARLAASKIGLPHYRADALLRIAAHQHEAKDAQSTAETLSEAAKTLELAAGNKERAISYLRLARAFADFEAPGASEVARDAVKAVNEVRRPKEDPRGESSWNLFPLAEAATETFRRLARKDRAGALSLADAFMLKEFKLAATLGVYDSTSK